MSRWTFIRRGSRLVVAGIFVSLFNLAPISASTAEALGNVTLVCKNTAKAAKGNKIKKRDLPKNISCTFEFLIQVRVSENGVDRIYFGSAFYDAPASGKKSGVVFSGPAASLVAISALYLYDPDTGEQIAPASYELVSMTPYVGETTGGLWTLPSGIFCTVAAQHTSRSELFPYNPAVYGGSDYERKSYVVTEGIDWECRR